MLVFINAPLGAKRRTKSVKMY